MGFDGRISGITTENLSVGNLFHAAFEFMADSYLTCSQRMSPQPTWNQIAISGGLVQSFAPLRKMIEDCYFAHIEPWLNPASLEDLWYFDGIPETEHRREQIFAAKPQRICFAGHYHRWLLVTPERTEPWNGSEPICLKDGRYFVVLQTLIRGAFATYDTTTGWLMPLQI